MRQSCNIIIQCCNLLEKINGIVKNRNNKYIVPPRHLMKQSMESLIHHFKFHSEGVQLNRGESFKLIEAPKGEFGISFVSDYFIKNRPYRCRIKSPGFLHLQGLEILVKDNLLADVVTIIGTIDVVFGEIDR